MKGRSSNRKLHKKMKMLDHTEIMDINLNMEHGIEYECSWKRKDCQKDSEKHNKNPHKSNDTPFF